MVPNILSSQDKFLNQLGVEEYELYTLVKEDGALEGRPTAGSRRAGEIAKWFPKKKSGATLEAQHAKRCNCPSFLTLGTGSLLRLVASRSTDRIRVS